MSYLPNLEECRVTRLLTDNFFGYDHNDKIADGAWWEEENLSTRNYPLFSPRQPRGRIGITGGLQGLCVKEYPAYVKDGLVYYNNTVIPGVTVSAEGEKQLVSMGAYLCIFPDGVYVNTQDFRDHGHMGHLNTISEGEITIAPCNMSGREYDLHDAYIQPKQPGEAKNGQYWIDTSQVPHRLKEYTDTTGQWIQITTVYAKLKCAGIADGLNKNDAVTISGVHAWKAPTALSDQVEKLNAEYVIQDIGTDYIVIIAILDEALTVDAAGVKVERRVPKMDFVCELDNRLWGCYYGKDHGKSVNAIYASALGDPKNWYRYEGIASDSYALSVGSDGPFTGICAYGGNILAWKENCVHKVYGNTPSTFAMTTNQCRGVAKGSHKSLAVVNEYLYYLSPEGVCSYDGSTPSGAWDAFAGEHYSEGRAGALAGRYYLSAKDSTGQWRLAVLDRAKQCWHLEDRVHAMCFAKYGQDLLYIDEDTNGIISETGANGDKECCVHWNAVSGIIGYEYPDQKYISRFNLRLQMGECSVMYVDVMYDSDGEWHNQMEICAPPVLRTFLIPVIPRRCDHMRIRLRGEGDVKIFSISKELEVSTDA